MRHIIATDPRQSQLFISGFYSLFIAAVIKVDPQSAVCIVHTYAIPIANSERLYCESVPGHGDCDCHKTGFNGN